MTLRLAAIALLYFVIAWAFHDGTINPFNTVESGEGFSVGFPSKIFATTFHSWNPYLQSGKFVYADVPSQSFYPPTLLILSLLPNTFGFNLFLQVHYALGGLFMYLYLRRLRLTTYSALIGGLMFMVCGFLTAHRGHECMICVAVWLPLTLNFIHRYAESLQIMDLGCAAVPFALSILAGFPQITLYSTLVILAYIPFCIAGSLLLREWKTKLVHIVSAAVVVFGIGGLLGCLPLFSVAEALPHLTRERLTYAMFTANEFPLWLLLTFFIPNLFGGVVGLGWPYAPHTAWVVEVYPYVGLLPLTLAFVGIGVWRTAGRELRFWIAVAAIALVISFGGSTPIYRLLFHLPVYNLFEAPARHLFELNLALSVIAAFGLDFLLRQSVPLRPPVSRLVRRTVVAMSFFFAIAVTAAVLLRSVAKVSLWRTFGVSDSAIVNNWYTFGTAKPIVLQNLSWSSPTMLMPLLFFALTVAIIAMLVRVRQRTTVMVAIPVLILADCFLASYRMYPPISTSPLHRPAQQPELAFLKARDFDTRHYRLFPVDSDLAWAYPQLNMFYGLPVINDYGPIWLKRYQTVTGFRPDGSMPPYCLQNYKVLSLLGTRYLMVDSPVSKRYIEQVTLDLPESHGTMVAGTNVDIWSKYSASGTDQFGFTLRKANNAAYSAIQTGLSLKPNTNYEISFVAHTDADLTESPLVIDLFALPSYASSETTRVLYRISKESSRYRIVINSGATPPTRGYVRLYTLSTSSIAIGNVQVRELEPETAKAFSVADTTPNGITIFENTNALPRFRFAHRVTPAQNLDDALHLMSQSRFNPADEVIVEGIDSGGLLAPGRFLSERLEDTRLEWDVETSGRSFLVVADSFLPGWTASVDDKPTPVYAVYGCVRGISIETAGRHRVEMRFAPHTLPAALVCSGIGLLLLGLFWLGQKTGRLSRLPFACDHRAPAPRQ
jgi:hypothetical protein